MLTGAMHSLDMPALIVGNASACQERVQFRVGNSHFTLIRLSVKQSGGRRLAKDAIRRVQKAQKFVDLRHRQVGNRVEVVRRRPIS